MSVLVMGKCIRKRNSMKTFNEEKWKEYRKANPELRFFQALREFCEVSMIFFETEENQLRDTYYITDERNKG